MIVNLYEEIDRFYEVLARIAFGLQKNSERRTQASNQWRSIQSFVRLQKGFRSLREESWNSFCDSQSENYAITAHKSQIELEAFQFDLKDGEVSPFWTFAP